MMYLIICFHIHCNCITIIYLNVYAKYSVSITIKDMLHVLIPMYL